MSFNPILNIGIFLLFLGVGNTIVGLSLQIPIWIKEYNEYIVEKNSHTIEIRENGVLRYHINSNVKFVDFKQGG